MTKELLLHTFAALQSLERCFENTKELLASNRNQISEELSQLIETIPVQEEILVKLRRCANDLQLAYARGDNYKALKTLKIFYGLHGLVRPELVATFIALNKGRFKNSHLKKSKEDGLENTFH